MREKAFEKSKPFIFYYLRKMNVVPYISFLLFAACSMVSLFTYFDNRLFDLFCLTAHPIYWWQYFEGVLEHSIYSKWFFWAHYLGNMSVIFILGILVEKIIGNTRMLLLSVASCTAYISSFQFFNRSGYDTQCGISGIVWSYAPIALYIIIRLGKSNRKLLFKGHLVYLFIFEFLFMWIFITSVSKWEGTNRYHTIATLVGILFLFIWRKFIDRQMKTVYSAGINEKRRLSLTDRFSVGVLLVVIILTGSILFRFYTNDLERLYTHEIGTSECGTFQQIQDNNGVIEIYFEAPVVGFRSIFTNTYENGKIDLSVDYSHDNRIMYLKLDTEKLNKDTGHISIKGVRLSDGRLVKNIKLDF